MELTFAEGRVLGCLVEKQLTTPQLYPLTENALIAACNQTTSRDPVVAYDVATVRLAVRSLRERDLLRTTHRTGERVDKHQHRLDVALGLSPAEVALFAVLVLRGPQTPGELRLRTDRMHGFGSVAEVEQVLEELAGRPEPLVARLERQPGHKEARYVDTVVPRDTPVPAVVAPGEATGEVTLAGLAREVASLRDEVAARARRSARGRRSNSSFVGTFFRGFSQKRHHDRGSPVAHVDLRTPIGGRRRRADARRRAR